MEPITHTFVLVAPDCPTMTAVIPVPRGVKPTGAVVQYDLLIARPYALTLEDLIFATHVRRAELSEAETKSRATEIRAELFSKSYPCMRASPLPKQYGWGVHHDGAGRIALFAVESEEYRRFARGVVVGVKVVVALRARRAG